MKKQDNNLQQNGPVPVVQVSDKEAGSTLWLWILLIAGLIIFALCNQNSMNVDSCRGLENTGNSLCEDK